MNEENEGITWSTGAELERQWVKESWRKCAGAGGKNKADKKRQATDKPHIVYTLGLDSRRYFYHLLLT